MDNQILRDVEDKKFTNFSNSVKRELRTKLSSNPSIEQYKSDYDKIQDMKNLFSKISTYNDREIEEPNNTED